MKRFAARGASVLWLSMLALGWTAAAEMPRGELRVEIHEPAGDRVLTDLEDSVRVEGGASVFGGVKYLDLFFVLDSSKSLLRTDRLDHRSQGAIGLVRNLPPKSDIQIGIVEFDRNAEMILPLTTDRVAVIEKLKGLDRKGATDIAKGIQTALVGFREGARPDSTRVILLFTDGKSDEDEAYAAMKRARQERVAIHTLQLGSDEDGMEMLQKIADGTGGSFIQVTDPAGLPEAFLNLRTTGVDHVTLRVGDGEQIPTTLIGGTFSGNVALEPGLNHIVASATSLDGETREDSVDVLVSGPLTLGIETPFDGTLYQKRESELLVEGLASIFAGLPSFMLENHSDRGIARVVLRVGEGSGQPALLSEGHFRGRVSLEIGENRIIATATSHDGRVADAFVTVTVRLPGCAELQVQAERDGEPVVSLSERGIELVFDASGSMWAQLDGKTKVEIGRETLVSALDWMPADLQLALRVYGHQHSREQKNCTDSELLVPLAAGDRERVRTALLSFKPRGQTPIAYSLDQIAGDMASFAGERAVVLVTDGIESCGGDPVASARKLKETEGITVHVIGFGMGGTEDEDQRSLRAIAEASGGRFVTARSAAELRDALTATVGTAWTVRKGDEVLGGGSLGSDDVIRLPEGNYTVAFASAPPIEVPVHLTSEEHTNLLLIRNSDGVTWSTRHREAEYRTCEAAAVADSSPSMPAVRSHETAAPPAAPGVSVD